MMEADAMLRAGKPTEALTLTEKIIVPRYSSAKEHILFFKSAVFDAAGKTFFEYLIQNSGGIISLRSRVKIDHTLYEPAEYEGLREFFNLIVKKHNEQIVFKKKK